MKTPCERVLWYVLPAIRKELVRALVEEHGYTQRKAARLLGLSDAAVSQYLSKKRGRLDIKDKAFLAEVTKSAKRIIKDGSKAAGAEVCRLCGAFRSSKALGELLEKGRLA